MFSAGTATIDITPPLGVSLAGSFTDRLATGIADPLYARAVVLEDSQGPSGRVAIVCCDLICMPGQTVRAARDLIARSGDVPPERVLIASTHTHTAPSPTGLLGVTRQDDYMDALPARIATAASLATQRLQPARAAWGSGQVLGASFNRRFHMRDGTVRMNPGRRNPDALRPAGPIDPEAGVLWIEAAAGAPLAVLTSFSLHYVGTDSSLHVSADYFGAFARWMQRLYGPDLTPILLNGASGDINNVDVHGPQQLAGRVQARRVAGVLAGAILQVVERLRPHDDLKLGAASARLPFRRKAVTPTDLEIAGRLVALPDDTPPAALRERAGLGPAGPFSWVVGQPLPDNVLLAYARECLVLSRLPETMETEVQALRIGDCAIVALPGEIFVELGLATKARSPFGPRRPAASDGSSGSAPSTGNSAGDSTEGLTGEGVTLIASLSNDYVGYVATQRAIEQEGGYETWAARSALPAAGAGEAMVDLAVEQLQSLAAD